MKVKIGKFVKVPKPSENDIEKTTQEEFNKVFSNMLGYTYKIILSEWNQEYFILGGITEKAEKEYEESIYKSLIAIGESEEYARNVVNGKEEIEGCMYFSKECFENIQEIDKIRENKKEEV